MKGIIMAKYRVSITYPCFVSVEVEADNEDDAIEKGFDEAHISSFMGNGGMDKLIGVTGSNVSIEAGDTALEGDHFEPTADIID